jgi:hypothetical protein
MHGSRQSAALASLRHISEVEALSSEDEPLIADLIAVLQRHNALDRFGITLLHKHFEMEPDECLLETTDLSTRVQTIRPISKAEVAGIDAIETAWRLDTHGPLMSCICIQEGSDHSHQSRGVAANDITPVESSTT